MEEDPQSLRMWFDSVDTDQSNSINVEELQVGKFLGLSILSKANAGVDYSPLFQLWRKELPALLSSITPGRTIFYANCRGWEEQSMPPFPRGCN